MPSPYEARMRAWVKDFIVPFNICPFAKREVERESIRYQVASYAHDNDFYDLMQQELKLLHTESEPETTLLILPQLDDHFEDFLNQAGYATQILQLEGYSGTIQIAHFHPHYVFTGSEHSDAANYTNRAPHAALHLLREDSLARVIRAHKNAEQIPADNIKLLREMGIAPLQQKLQDIYKLGKK